MMKWNQWNTFISSCLGALLVVMASSFVVFASDGGWVYEDGWSYIHANGNKSVNAFEQIDGNTYYFDGDAHYVTGWKFINSDWYYFDLSDGHMITNAYVGNDYLGPDGTIVQIGWQHDGYGWKYIHPNGSFVTKGFDEIDGMSYYFDRYGHYVTGWQLIDGEFYYFYPDGHMAKDEFVDGHYVNAYGKYLVVGWISDSNGWKYIHKDGSNPVLDFEEIEGKWYYFDASGYMVRGWQKVDAKWYYFYYDGHMAVDEYIGEFYLSTSGDLIYVGWQEDNHGWYYRHTDHSCTYSNFEEINGLTYYFDANGYMVTGWKLINEKWYYFYPDGHMGRDQWIGHDYVCKDGYVIKVGWQEDNNGWYYRYRDNSYPKSEFAEIKGCWYYFNGAGYMVTGWQDLPDGTYYFYPDGHMASNEWVDGFFIMRSGKKVTPGWNLGKDEWNQERWFYLHADGSYTTSDFEMIDGYWYYFYSNGYCASNSLSYIMDGKNNGLYSFDEKGHMIHDQEKSGYYFTKSGRAQISGWQNGFYFLSNGWICAEEFQYIDGYWYYFQSQGRYAHSGWEVIDGKYYYFYANGHMAKNTTIDGRTIGNDGSWTR